MCSDVSLPQTKQEIELNRAVYLGAAGLCFAALLQVLSCVHGSNLPVAMAYSAACLIVAGFFLGVGAAIYELNLKYFDELVGVGIKTEDLKKKIRRQILSVSNFGVGFGTLAGILDFLGVFGNADWLSQAFVFVDWRTVLIVMTAIVFVALLFKASRTLECCKDDFKDHLPKKSR
ncbi:hypothetical protein [Acidocella facilis]|uniref:hypothetical protein n=1 Tax=Acidocella facilis TaxID=525 RepID=UPI0012DE646F|nr:hypothetical protein [Acidocella facilis]